MDRHIGRDGGAAGRQGLEDQRRVEPREPRAANVVRDINAAHAERGGLAHFGDGKVLGLVPGERVRREMLGGESARHVANGGLLLGEGELRRLAGGLIKHGRPGVACRPAAALGLEPGKIPRP